MGKKKKKKKKKKKMKNKKMKRKKKKKKKEKKKKKKRKRRRRRRMAFLRYLPLTPLSRRPSKSHQFGSLLSQKLTSRPKPTRNLLIGKIPLSQSHPLLPTFQTMI